MRKAVFFDFGNTLIEYDPVNIVKSFGVYGEDADLLVDRIFTRKIFDRLDAGTLEQQDFINEVMATVPERLHTIAKNICDTSHEHLPVISGMPELLEKLKKDGFELYVLSNINKHFAENRNKVWIFKYFDGFIFSSTINITKPSKEIFEYALKKFDLKASEAFFVDDIAKNIEGAKNAGIDGFLFNFDPAETEKAIYGKFK